MASVDVTRIAANIGALNALNSLQNINKQLAVHQGRLATGKRINSAADDPAGLTIATKMLARSEGLKVAGDNIGDAKNMLAVAESGLSKLNDIMLQMRSKAEQAASDTLGATERQAIQTQLSSFSQQIDAIVSETKWNGVQLLDGSVSKRFQTGADAGEYTNWTLSQKHDAYTLGLATLQSSNAASSLTGGLGYATTDAYTVKSTLNSMSALATGTYSVEILDTAATTTLGKATPSGMIGSGFAGISATSGATNELSSGMYTFQITGGTGLSDGTSVDWRILDSTGTIAKSGSGGNFSTGMATAGVVVTTNGALSAGQSFQFEYIAMGAVKYELNDASGVAQTVDVDGSGTGTTTGTAGYFSALAAGGVDTGRGVSFGNYALASVSSGAISYFQFKAASNYSVDVSTAGKASTYMNTVNSAMDTVNASMANLGSLMARLTFKEDQVSTAQINVEASYNRIMNANMAEEQVNASKFAILQQTSTAMLAQANVAPQTLLSLFR